MVLKCYAKVHSLLLHLGTIQTSFHSMQDHFSGVISTSAAAASFLSSFTIMIMMLKLTNMDLL